MADKDHTIEELRIKEAQHEEAMEILRKQLEAAQESNAKLEQDLGKVKEAEKHAVLVFVAENVKFSVENENWYKLIRFYRWTYS